MPQRSKPDWAEFIARALTALDDQIAELQRQRARLAAVSIGKPGPRRPRLSRAGAVAAPRPRKRRKVSAATRAKQSAAAKARWAEVKKARTAARRAQPPTNKSRPKAKPALAKKAKKPASKKARTAATAAERITSEA